MSKKVFINNGDLNSDPFYLTKTEARMLAAYLGDEQLSREINEAVWEGADTMVPIAQKYYDAWEELKTKKGLCL